MKVFVYNYRDFDEGPFFHEFAERYGLELAYTVESPTLENCDLAAGCDFISVITTPITPPMIDRFLELGVRMVSTRTIGYDHIDCAYAKKAGMIVSHITYDPEGVADYTVMMILMAVRKVKTSLRRNSIDDFSLEGLLGKRMADLRIGVVGAGRIGRSVLRDLSGFGCKLMYTNRSPSEEADRYAERVDLERLLAECDVVSLHLEHNRETDHLMNRERLSLMKEGAILVNTARGPLVDSKALIDALESGHLGGAALDVIEGEFGLYYNDMSRKVVKNHEMQVFRALPNVILTHHLAFYYESAVRDMVQGSLYSMKMLKDGENIPFRLV
ncbi:MAG: NAD(P)-binding domain-containing protein [archaeon]|nr:NAD(P)-binding domain-containing protein [archaeon]